MRSDVNAPWQFVPASDLTNETVEFHKLQVRSVKEDEELGTVKGFVVDAQTGQLHYVVVDSGGWFSNESYLIPPAYTRVDAEQRVLWAELSRDTIRRFPEFSVRDYPVLSHEQLWTIERSIITAYGDDPGVVAPSADWNRESWAHTVPPQWWSDDYAGRSVGLRSAAGDRPTAGWPDPATDRAQPGDVLGIERGGERTALGETAADEDDRRERAEREFRDELEEEIRSRTEGQKVR